ncbi:hypothetical protein UFOVP218_66 [uncultured Caudovirales phage]|uniref:Uncharacterized protein n=1 Tax=uncultured Caudovirales phage TaxID=2100421 RepID=A0A6J7WKV5_9CAUD|nr:hypothetical protein UFOVP218_66 [uncultured Caudovirales phage]
MDKIIDNFYDKPLTFWVSGIVCGLVIIASVHGIYTVGVRNTHQALCDQLGGIYINTYTGNKCLMTKEVPLP